MTEANYAVKELDKRQYFRQDGVTTTPLITLAGRFTQEEAHAIAWQVPVGRLTVHIGDVALTEDDKAIAKLQAQLHLTQLSQSALLAKNKQLNRLAQNRLHKMRLLRQRVNYVEEQFRILLNKPRKENTS